MKLIIAEKPSVAQTIAAVLGATERKDGYTEGGGYVVSWCVGHLVGLAEAAAYGEQYEKWSYESLPILPQEWQYTIAADKQKQFKILKEQMNRADVTGLVNACDAGREGELIFRFVYLMAKCKKPFSRLWISSMEDDAIRKGFASLKDGKDYDPLFHSALCRAKADWIIGINATRLFSVLYNRTLNVGRVQTPTLKMLADRDGQISHFKKEKYHIVRLTLDSVEAASARISTAEEAAALKAACETSQAVCVSLTREQKTVAPPKLFDLTSLQREANRIYGYTAKQTLDLAQTLYEKRLLTYPRTDSQFLTDDMGGTAASVAALLTGKLPFMAGVDFTPDVSRLLNSKKVSDHHAIIPTVQLEKTDLAALPESERNILTLAGVAVSARKVQNKRDGNGELTGKPGTVYDVNIKYASAEGKKTYSKKGFSTKKEATQHEAEMKTKLANPTYSPITSPQSKQTVKEYLEEWVENHGKANLRPSTFAGYKSHIKNHILPYIGHVPLRQLTPAMLDNMFQQLFDKGLSNSTVRYAQRILSVSMEHARKYRYIETNPARDIITKFGKQGKTPDPYTIEQLQKFMGSIIGTEWEMPVVLAGLYGLRMSEIIGLRTNNIDLEKMQFGVVEQMPFKVPPGTKTITEMAPTKSNDRLLPITEETLPYFLRQLDLIERQKELLAASGGEYYDNKLLITKPDGSPHRRDRMSANFGQLIRHLEMSHIRFHDLRHTAATNMHQLTGDFYTVGEILGHTLKGIGISLGISTNLEAVTAQYVDVRLERKKTVLETYHKALQPKKVEQPKEAPTKDTPKKGKKKSSEMEL